MKDEYYLDPRIAAGYDAEVQTQEDVPFYLELARECASRGLPVLELGAGTGRVTIPIAQAGVSIVGLERSQAMLDVARRKSEGITNPGWVEGDMAAFELEKRFGLIIIPCRSFLMLLTVAEQKSCLSCVKEHLVPGGRLALNIFNPNLVMTAQWLQAGKGDWKEDASLPAGLRRKFATEYHPSTQTADQVRLEEELSDSGAVISRVQRNLRFRYVFRYEMEHLLALSGFEVEALYGDFDKRQFDDDCSEMVWVAKKA